MYLTDPNLNLLDPNNTTGGGGALLLDLDTGTYFGGQGVAIPQTDTTVGNFNGTYVFGAQDYNATGLKGPEFNFLGQGSLTASTEGFAGTGVVDDTFEYFAASNSGYTGVPFTGTAAVDATNVGRFTMVPLDINVTGTASPFTTVIYQANRGQLFWLNEDANTLFLGPIETSSFTGVPSVRSRFSKTQVKRKQYPGESTAGHKSGRGHQSSSTVQ
jgi:hypothetical protein